MPQNLPQQSPFQIAMDFAMFEAKIWDELTGSISVIKQEGEVTGPDGTKYPNLIQVKEHDPSAVPICNENGARRVQHQIRLIMNQNNAFADLSKDAISQIAENACKQAFSPMFANRQEYGITDLNKLETEGLAIYDTLYIFLTSLAAGGVRNAAISLYQVKVESKEDNTKPQGLVQ